MQSPRIFSRLISKLIDLVIIDIDSPTCPASMDWSSFFPRHFAALRTDSEGCTPLTGKKVEWVDIGCGFGGLISALAPLYPDVLMLGEHVLHDVPEDFAG